MSPIGFPGANVIFAEDQPEYLPLPAFADGHVVVTCWTLTLWERIKLLWRGRVWLQQYNFGHPLQPQLPCVDRPTEYLDRGPEPVETPDPTEDGDYTEAPAARDE